MAQANWMSRSVFHLFILVEINDTKNKLLVKGLHSADIEPLRSFLQDSLSIQIEQNSSFQLTFTAYDDGSVAFNMLSVESSVFWGNDEYIIKQLSPEYSSGFTTYQVTAIHVGYDIARIRQRKTRTGTLTYTVEDVLSFYLQGNSLGYTWQVIGNFDKQQITDLGNGSGKDMLDQIVKTWPDAIFYPEKRNIRIYQHDAFAKNIGQRIDYIRDTPEIKMSYDSTEISNQVLASGKVKENTDGDAEEYYFDPFIVEDEESVQKWGLHPGEDISDERFTDKKSMETYAKSQLHTEPTLSIEITQYLDARPRLGEIRRLENRKDGFVTEVEIVGFTYYPLNKKSSTVTLNNRAKTILNYQSNKESGLKKAISQQKQTTRSISVEAKQAYKSRLIGHLASSETTPLMKANETLPVHTLAMNETLPVYTLAMAEDNPDFGLPKGTKIAVQTTVDGVVGLKDAISAGNTVYYPATHIQDGLMSKDDKAKLDNLKQGPVDSIGITDSSTGSIYNLTVVDGKIKLQESDK